MNGRRYHNQCDAAMTVMNGRILYVNSDTMWLARGTRLLETIDGGQTWRERAELPIGRLKEQLVRSRLGRRLGRVGFHHLVRVGPEEAVVVAHRHVFHLAEDSRELIRVAPVSGSRPLTLCAGAGLVCYGEYRGNPERAPVHVWAAKAHDVSLWEPVWRFDHVRHVHGVFFDAYTSAFWVTTGDRDHESALWTTTDRFQTLDCVVGGSQCYRAVQLLFTERYVYFGSDAPDQINQIYRLERRTGRVEPLTKVSGPVFYGCTVGDHLFFSTVVEPSDVNTGGVAEIWGSRDGENWRMVRRFRKDAWSMKYFQYGQVLFPSGPGDAEHLWCTPMATEKDQQTLKYHVSDLGL